MLKSYFHFAGNNRHFLLFGLLTAFFGNYGQSFFIAWFGASFQKEFDLSNTEYGFVYSSATLVSGLLILYVGALLDKISLKKFTTTTIIGLICACILLYGAYQVWQLVLAIFLLRLCGQGLMFHIAFTSMSRYFVENRGKAIAIVALGMPLGEAILPAIAVVLINTIGWRESWLLLGFILCLFIPVTYRLLSLSANRQTIEKSPSLTSKTSNNQVHWNRRAVIKDFRFWSIIPTVMAPAFIVTGLFIHQSILLETKQWSEQWFATGFIIYAISHLKASLVIGALVDKYSGKKLFNYYLIPIFLAVALLALPTNYPIVTLVFMFLTGLTIGAAGPIIGSLWVEVYGNQSIAAIRSLVTSITVIATAVSPVLLGWLFDNDFSYYQVMLCLLSYLVIAWCLSYKALYARPG